MPRGLREHTVKRGIDDGGWPAAVRYEQVSTQRDGMNWRLVIALLRAQPFTSSRNRRSFDKKRISQVKTEGNDRKPGAERDPFGRHGTLQSLRKEAVCLYH